MKGAEFFFSPSESSLVLGSIYEAIPTPQDVGESLFCISLRRPLSVSSIHPWSDNYEGGHKLQLLRVYNEILKILYPGPALVIGSA